MSQFFSELDFIFAEGRFCGDGSKVLELEARLADYHGVRSCVAVANAGLGLFLLLRHNARRDGEVLLPAFTFRGLPHFVRMAGQRPHFCDVDRRSHALDPAAVESVISRRTTAVLAVWNFNAPPAIAQLFELARASGVPLFLDSVYGVGSSFMGVRAGGHGSAEVFSLHATKLINGFEGGYITTNEPELAEELRKMRTGRAELNELHAAMALLSLDALSKTIERNRERFELYREAFHDLDGVTLLEYPSGDSSTASYQLVVAKIGAPWPLRRDQMVDILRAEGAAINPYYSPPLHLGRTLPVTAELAECFLQLPSGELVLAQDIERLAEFLAFIQAHGDEIRRRLP